MNNATQSKPLFLDDNDLFVGFRFPGESDFAFIKDDGLSSNNYKFIIHPFDKNSSSPTKICSKVLLQNVPFSFSSNSNCPLNSTEKDNYFTAANNLIQKMNQTELQKVVLSRVKLVPNNGMDCYHLFQNLSKTYPRAFVFFYNIPGKGTWMGATPEVLFEEKNGQISTVALAATQKINDRDIDQVKWNEKEVEEQAIIQRYIESSLDDLAIAYKKSPTETAQAGNVYHIKTSYQFNSVDSPSKLLDKLHPGPAICGVPKSHALKEINNAESHNRGFYCGYLGLKSGEETRYFINLRSMQVFADYFALFVGGGLTSDSEASSEWEETEIKSKTLEAVIQKSYIYAHDVE